MNRRLVSAVNDNDMNEVERLLSSGASPDAYDHDGKCPVLVTACDNGFSSIVQVLLKKGSNVNKTDDLGNTALMVAVQRGDVSLIAMLLSAKADVNLKNTCGWTAQDLAKDSNHSTVISLLRSRCDINKANVRLVDVNLNHYL
ncbi:protein phosphatase 1 regulatory subunit 16A-like [Corticium candelabrum]|uniref:protein phosphatase 1 regulatory subunit 16A-like n=1 Tax=Corticium candelabrum TaxID=121492 RepID=UPI002E25E67F|nr:protein phosphatase 1 regulatory subunit 16A-like [Corticium candelabrum]